MYSAEIIIYVSAIILGSLFIILAVLSTRNDKNYQEYVESIKIGDTFGNNNFKFSNVDDPFSENYDAMGFDPMYHVTILDIRKNHKGETWVKYCFTRNINTQHCEWTEEINDFLRYRT